ncbi:helix-turn-helix domain-containing protein [Lacticaseibacillus daqingensis]|uniref:hypothetical protein n=1 Tax=Lacticaseibacillus daqingensis TaxID=2486014 RepID=UPI000F7820F4|nr:hypothetical protein [Lacticaseibacillus daqingensis]
MTATLAAGFALSLKHRGVLHTALARVGLRRSDPDYPDYLQDAHIIYAEYYVTYDAPPRTHAALIKFNRLAGFFIYLRLMQKRSRARTHEQGLATYRRDLDQTLRAQTVAAAALADNTRIDQLNRTIALTTLWATATPRERRVLALRASGANDRAIARTLHLTPRSVGRIRQHLAERYTALLG